MNYKIGDKIFFIGIRCNISKLMGDVGDCSWFCPKQVPDCERYVCECEIGNQAAADSFNNDDDSCYASRAEAESALRKLQQKHI